MQQSVDKFPLNPNLDTIVVLGLSINGSADLCLFFLPSMAWILPSFDSENIQNNVKQFSSTPSTSQIVSSVSFGRACQ